MGHPVEPTRFADNVDKQKIKWTPFFVLKIQVSVKVRKICLPFNFAYQAKALCYVTVMTVAVML